MSTAVYVVYATRTLDLDWLPANATVVVVHNDAHLDRASLRRPVVHVEPGANVGFGAGINYALPSVDGPRVVLCNPDLVLTSEHWRALIDDVTVDEVVTIPLRDATGVSTSVCSRYPTPLSHLMSGYRVGRWFPRGSKARTWLSRLLGASGRAHRESLATPTGNWPLSERWVSGAALSIDAERLRAVGGFDEGYFLYAEDVDLCARLARRDPEMRAVVVDVEPGIHEVGGTAAGESLRVERIRLESALRYAEAQPGTMWSLCATLLRARRRLLR